MLTVLITLIGILGTLYLLYQQAVLLATFPNTAIFLTTTAQLRAFADQSGEKGITSSCPLLHAAENRQAILFRVLAEIRQLRQGTTLIHGAQKQQQMTGKRRTPFQNINILQF